jgi:hypothetical protein
MRRVSREQQVNRPPLPPALPPAPPPASSCRQRQPLARDPQGRALCWGMQSCVRYRPELASRRTRVAAPRSVSVPVAMVARLLGRLQSPAQLILTPVHCRHTVATGPAQHQLVNSFVGDRSLPTSPARAAEVGDAVDCRNRPRKGVAGLVPCHRFQPMRGGASNSHNLCIVAMRH